MQHTRVLTQQPRCTMAAQRPGCPSHTATVMHGPAHADKRAVHARASRTQVPSRNQRAQQARQWCAAFSCNICCAICTLHNRSRYSVRACTLPTLCLLCSGICRLDSVPAQGRRDQRGLLDCNVLHSHRVAHGTKRCRATHHLACRPCQLRNCDGRWHSGPAGASGALRPARNATRTNAARLTSGACTTGHMRSFPMLTLPAQVALTTVVQRQAEALHTP